MAEYDEWVWTGVYTLLSMITRFWRIGEANYVVWDEVSTIRILGSKRELMCLGSLWQIRVSLH